MRTRSIPRWMVAAGVAVAMASSIAMAAVDLTAAGASFPYPLYVKWISEYQKATGNKVSYTSTGSGKGIDMLKNEQVDFAGSDAPISDADMRTMPGRVLHFPTCAGSVALAYNLSVDRQVRLDAETTAGIFLGKITRWNDAKIRSLNPGVNLPNTAITVCHRSDGSGTTHIFTSYLSAVSSEWRSKVGAGSSVKWPVGVGGPKNDGVAGLVKKTPGAIGYVELAYAIRSNLDVVSLRNKAGRFITPSLRSTTISMQGFINEMKRDVRFHPINTAHRDGYSIVGLTWILAYELQKDKAKMDAVKEFIAWGNTEGQKYCSELLYAPLPSELVEINNANMNRMKLR